MLYRASPNLFVREVLGFQPWKRQEEILLAVARSSRVAVRSGHKTGKSKIAAALALWYASTHAGARVILTAPTHRQIRAILWREIRSIYYSTSQPLGGVVHESPEAGLRLPNESEIVGFSTTEPERMAGISGVNVLFIVDEASGVPEQIFEAIEGNRAGGAKLVLFSNPTQTSGTFFNAFHAKRDFWRNLVVSSTETPPIPGLATQDWVEEKKREWGEESPLYQVRVLGNFPDVASNSVVSFAALEAAKARYEDTVGEGTLHIGVDVARFGDDDTAIVTRRGKKILSIDVVHGLDVVQVAGRVIEIVKARAEPGEVPNVSVDVIGVGAGVADLLREHRPLEVFDVNSSERAGAENEYFNLRSEIAFGVADWLADGGALPDDGALEAELLSLRYIFDARGRRRVISKDDIKKHLGRSPDRADALALVVRERYPFSPTTVAGAGTRYEREEGARGFW